MVKEPSKKLSGVCGVSVTFVDVKVIVHHTNCGLYSSPIVPPTVALRVC